MMRRSRISIKPNFRSGNRTGAEGEQASQRVSVADDTLPAADAEELLKPAPSHQQNTTLKEPSEDVGLKETPEMPSKMNQNDGAPSSGATTSTPAAPRRMRISATPNLLRPKFSSTPRSRPSARMPSSAPSPLLNEEHVQIYDSASQAQDSVSLISNKPSESDTPCKSKSASQLPTQSCTMTQSSLCITSTSAHQKSPLHGKKSVENSPPSPQPCQVPQQSPQEQESLECPSTSDLSLASTKPSYSDKAGSSEMTEKSSDKDQILRALKLKELMKIERRKDIKKEKRKVGYKMYTALDRGKMTMRDLIYYLPNTSPMRSSIVDEENPVETVIPASPKEQIKTAEMVDEEEEEEESENEEMLVPRVRVAEDGSIILDDESLTVRVQRTSNTKVVENSAALFERGSTTTYSSFRAVNYVKSWSVRETDLFFLAISMVGTDFSLIGQLLTHRSRTAIKSKFKKEERVNPWRVDKALMNKRPFDKEFFSYLLEKVLAKDKDKRKSIKLVLPKAKKPRRSKGKTSKEICVEDDDDDDDDAFLTDDPNDLEEDGAVSIEKESQDASNVKEAENSVPSKKRRKHTRDKDDSTEEQVKRKRQRKCSKKTREVEDGTEGEHNLNGEGDVLNVHEEDELERSTLATKRRRKRSKSDENEKPVKKIKCKRNKKSLKVEEEGTAEGGEASAGLQETEQLNTPVTSEVADNVPPKATRRSKKPVPKLASARSKKRNKPESSAEAQMENRDEMNHESTLTAAGSRLQDERLQMQPVVVLEKTPPRQQYSLSPSKDKGTNNELEPSMRSSTSPSSSESSSTQQTRMRRARKVKRDLSTSQKARRRKETMAQDEPEPENPMALLESITRESEEEEDDDYLNENLMDFSCLRDLDSHMFQRRPMVVLSREEVDMILHTSEQSAEEDPSVSPLDLSLNTELSLPLQCSKLLEDNYEEAVVDCMFEEHGRTNESTSSETRNCEELETKESELAQSDVCNICTSLTPEVCDQPEVALSNITTSCPVEEAEPQVHPVTHKVSPSGRVLNFPPPLVVLDNIGLLCMKPDVAEATEVIEEPEKVMLPNLLKEPGLASSEITAQSKLTSLGRGLGPQRSLQAVPEVKGEFQTSVEGPSQTLKTLRDSSESKEDTQESAVPRREIKASTQSCAVALEDEADSQDLSVQYSSASISSERGIKPTTRSRFLKPKPNLSQKSRATVLQNQRQHLKSPSTLKSKSSKPSSTEKVLHSPANDQHHSLEDFSKQNLSKEKDTSNTMDRMESDSTEDLGDAATAIPDQNTTTVSLNLTSADEPQEASVCSKSDADMRTPSTSLTSHQPSHTREDSGVEKMIVPSENVCAPAEIVHLSEDSDNDEEPSFILTLYEIPVTQAYLPSTLNDSEMTSDLLAAETQAFLGSSDQTHSLPSTSDSSNIDPLQSQNSLSIDTKDIISLHMKDEDSVASANLENDIPTLHTHSGCKKSDLAPSIHSTTSGSSDTKCITTLLPYSMDTKKCKKVSQMQLANVFVPVSEDTGDEDRTMAVESKLKRTVVNLSSVAERFAESIKEETSPHKPILLDTKLEDDGDACGIPETVIPFKDPNSECKMGSEFAPIDLTSRTQNPSSGSNISRCITTLDAEQCDSVSQGMLSDVFVPVSEKTGNDTGKDGAMAVECKLESSEATQDLCENDKEKISEHLSSLKPVLMKTKDEESDVVDVKTGNPHLDHHTEGKNGSEIAPLEGLASRTNRTPSGLNISKGITSHQGSEDTERVPHVLLADVFVPASEETGGTSSKDWTMAVESKKAIPYVDLTKVGNSPVVSDPLSGFDSMKSKDAPSLSEKTKAPARRRARQKLKPQPKLMKRACTKFAFSTTDEVVKEPSQPSSAHAVSPASCEENQQGNSNTITVESGGKKTSARGGSVVKPKSIAEESPKMSQGDLEPTETNTTSALQLSKKAKLEEENGKNVMGDATIKDESIAEEKERREDVRFQLMKSSGSVSSTVDSEKTEAESRCVSRVLLPDVFVLVSDETDDNLSNDWRVPIESSPQRVSLPKEAGTDFQKEFKTEDVSQSSIEESTQSQSPLEETKTPVRKRADKQAVKRMCTQNESTKTRLRQPTSPRAQGSSLPQSDMLLVEEKLQRKHHIMPCTIRLSSIDTVAQSLNAPQLGDMKSSDKSTGDTTLSEESSTPPLLGMKTLVNPEFEKKSPIRRKGKKKESSQDTKRSHLQPVQTVSQSRQLTITDWVKKKSHQTAKTQEIKQPMEFSHMQSGLKVYEVHQFKVEKTCSKSQHKDLEKPEGSHVEETEDMNRVSTEIQDVKRSSEMVKELTEDPTVSRVKDSPVRQRAKLQVKPILLKRSWIKSEGDTSASDQPQPKRFTSPTRQHARAARKKDNKNKQSVGEVTSTSMETNSLVKESSWITSGPHSPNSQDIWPRVVLPHVKLRTTEAGVYSTSSMPTSSPARLSPSASPPAPPPQLKKSPTQSSSPTAGENLEDDPSRVSQFFLCDIFTEVEEPE